MLQLRNLSAAALRPALKLTAVLFCGFLGHLLVPGGFKCLENTHFLLLFSDKESANAMQYSSNNLSTFFFSVLVSCNVVIFSFRFFFFFLTVVKLLLKSGYKRVFSGFCIS